MNRQPAFAILTLCLALVLTVPAIAAEDEEKNDGPRPVMVVPEPMVDFGEIPRGEKVEHEYIIRNDGQAHLEITRVAPSCGCSVAEFDRTIAPGKTGTVKALINTATLSGPTSRGISLFTNDPDNPKFNLAFKIDSVAYLNVEPGYARYVAVHGEAPRGIIKQWIWAHDGGEFEVVKVDSPYTYLTTSFRPAPDDDRFEEGGEKQWIVESELKYNEAPVGPLADYLLIHTNHAKQKEMRIPVSGFVRPTIWVTPQEANFGEISLEEPLTFSLLVHNFATQALELTSVDSDLNGLKTQVNPIEEGRKYSVQVTMEPSFPKGSFDGKITIRTSSPTKPILEIPLKGKVL